VNRVFTLKAASKDTASNWMMAIESAKPLTEAQLLQERDGHKEGKLHVHEALSY
jgi:hypothetical protein